MGGLTAALLLAAVPALALAAALTARWPRRAVLCAYAAAVPFGSGITVPVPLPAPFNTLTTLLGLATVAVFALGLLHPGGQARRIPAAALIALLLLAAHAVTYAWSIDRGASFDAVLVLGSLVVLFVVVAASHLDADDLRWFQASIVVGGALACAYGLVLLLTDQLPQEAAGVARFATAGGVGDDSDPNITAATLVLPLLLAVGFAVDRRGWWRAGAGAAAVLLATGILLTASRGGLAGAVVALVVLLLARRPSARTVGALLGAAVGLALVVSVVAPAQFERLSRSGSSGRTSVWELGLAACDARCATGSGIGTYLEVHQDTFFHEPWAEGVRASLKAHNIWLQAGVETGVLGVGLLLALFVATGVALLRVPRALRAPPLAALAGLLVTNAFLGNLAFKYFWLVLVHAVVVAAASAEHRGARRPEPVVALLASTRGHRIPAMVIALGAALAVFALSADGRSSYRAVATVVASRSPEVEEVGIDEAVEAVFEARQLDAELVGRAGAIAYQVIGTGRDAEAAVIEANEAAATLADAFAERPVAFTELIVAQRARPALAERVGGPEPLPARALGAVAAGVAAGVVLAVADAARRNRGPNRRRATAPATTPLRAGAFVAVPR